MVILVMFTIGITICSFISGYCAAQAQEAKKRLEVLKEMTVEPADDEEKIIRRSAQLDVFKKLLEK